MVLITPRLVRAPGRRVPPLPLPHAASCPRQVGGVEKGA
jgi:hypothetical protein